MKIYVPQGKWQQLQGDGQLYTTDIDTCIGVSVYSPAKRKAFLGHFDATSHDNKIFKRMMVAVSEEFAQDITVKAWVGGGAIIDPGTLDYGYDKEVITIANDETQVFRERVISDVTDLVPQHSWLRTNWLDIPAYIAYSINVATGEEDISLNELT